MPAALCLRLCMKPVLLSWKSKMRMSSAFKNFLEEKRVRPPLKREKKAVDVDKYKFLFEYQKASFDAERDRYFKFEDKGAKYLSHITIFIGLYVFLIKIFTDSANNSPILFELLYFLSVFATVFFGGRAWMAIFRCVKINSFFKMPCDEELIMFFKKNKRDGVYLYLSKLYSKATMFYEEKNLERGQLLATAHKQIIATGFAFVVSVVFGLLWVCAPAKSLTNQQATLPAPLHNGVKDEPTTRR